MSDAHEEARRAAQRLTTARSRLHAAAPQTTEALHTAAGPHSEDLTTWPDAIRDLLAPSQQRLDELHTIISDFAAGRTSESLTLEGLRQIAQHQPSRGAR